MKLIFLRKIGKIWILNKKDYITFLCLFMIHNFTNYTASSSVQFSRSVVSDSLQPHGLQHTRSPRLSPTPGTYSNYVHHIGDAINHLICRSLLLLPSIFPSIKVFSNKSVLCIRWPNYWSSSFSISRSNEYSGLISFRMDWLHLLAVQETHKSLLQHHSSKTSILWHTSFFTVQFKHPSMTTGENIALTRRSFVGKIMSLPFNMLSKLVINFLPRSKHLLIS